MHFSHESNVRCAVCVISLGYRKTNTQWPWSQDPQLQH